MPYKPLGVQLTEEDKLYRRYWTGLKGEDMGFSKRQIQAKVDRMKSSVNSTLRLLKRVELPTAKELEEADVWDEETLAELEEHMAAAQKIIIATEKSIEELIRPYETQARQVKRPPKKVECPECKHEFGLEGRPANENL